MKARIQKTGTLAPVFASPFSKALPETVLRDLAYAVHASSSVTESPPVTSAIRFEVSRFAFDITG